MFPEYEMMLDATDEEAYEHYESGGREILAMRRLAEGNKDVFELIHKNCGKDVQIIVDVEKVEFPNPDFEVCREEWHDYHNKQCNKGCPDYENCSKGELLLKEYLVVKAVCVCGKEHVYLKLERGDYAKS